MGANRAVLRIDHPDILEFIEATQTSEHLENFNLVAIVLSILEPESSECRASAV